MPPVSTPEAIALDVGGTSLSSAIVDRSGVVANRRHGPIEQAGDEATIVARLAEEIVAQADAAVAPVPVTIGFPGPFDYPAGVPLLTHKFASLHGRPLGRILAAEASERLGRPIGDVRFCNDAAAAGVGAAWSLAADAGRVWVLLFGTGLGSALVVDGAFVESDGALATTELWQLPAEPAADPSGERADDQFSARGLARALGVEPGALPVVLGQDPGPEVRVALDRWTDRLAVFVRAVLEHSPADRLVIGGGVACSLPLFGPRLSASLDRPVDAAHGGVDVALVGAALACGVRIERPDR